MKNENESGETLDGWKEESRRQRNEMRRQKA